MDIGGFADECGMDERMAGTEPDGVRALLKALIASEARFRAIFEKVDALSIQGYAADGTVTYWNPASTRLYGYSREEAVGASLYDLIIPEPAREIVRRDVQWMFEHRQGVPAARLALQHKDGHVVNVYSSHTIVEAPDHPLTMYCLDVDLNQLVRIEQELSEAEQRYRLLFDGTADGILLLDGLCIVDCNATACRLFGATREQLLGRSPVELSPEMQPGGLPSLELARRYVDDVISDSSRIFQWVHQRLDGNSFDAEVHLSGVRLDKRPLLLATLHDISERKRAEAHIEYISRHDALTGLPNRVLLRDRFDVARAIADRQQSMLAVMFIDLDHFKVVNDTMGHAAGDALLKRVVDRFRARVRESDTISRQGGDEFIVLLQDMRALTAVDAIAHSLLDSLAEAITINERELGISASIGIALYPQDGENFDVLLQRADMAMYTAKAAGRNKARFYSASMQIAIDRRVQLDSAMRRALAQRELQLHFQPQVDAQGCINGAEALLRWFPPEGRAIPPADFIGLAEETGFIVEIGHFVIDEACRTLRLWADDALFAGLTLAINISARQFRERNFEEELAAMLARHQINPARLKLELTESVVIDHVDEAVQRMNRLRQLGLQFSLDDFGTGYSSLSYLRTLPLQQIKIDRAFVQHLDSESDRPCNDQAIVAAILAMSQALDLYVVAEGIETAGQHDILRTLGCNAFQGYYFARPMSASAFETLVRECAGGPVASLRDEMATTSSRTGKGVD